MKTLKIILIIIAVIIVVPLIVALFTAKDYAVERQITINKPLEQVWDYVKYLKNQDNYSKWASMDPQMEKSFRGEDGMVGFVSAWESDNPDVGKGEQEIMAIIPSERIDYELRFIEPFESNEKAYMITEATGDNQTLVKWGFKGRMEYPMNLMLLVMDFEAMLAGDFETGLSNLKTVLEKQE